MDRLRPIQPIQDPKSVKPDTQTATISPLNELRVIFPKFPPSLADAQAPLAARRVCEGFPLLSLPPELQDSILCHLLSFEDKKDFIQMGNLLHAVDEEIQATKTSELAQESKVDKRDRLVNFAKVCLGRFKFDAIDLTAGFNKITIFQLIHKKASRVLAEASDYNPKKPFKFQTIGSLTVFANRTELASQLFDAETTTIHISEIDRQPLFVKDYDQEIQGYKWNAQMGLQYILTMLICIEENWARSVKPQSMHAFNGPPCTARGGLLVRRSRLL